MSQLRFNHQQKKRKTWLFPLIVIILLYVSIPFLLIQKGDESLKNAISKTKDQKVEIPPKEYKSGIVFLEIAESFPGFTTWATKIKTGANEKMIEIYQLKCKHKSAELFKQLSDYSNEYDSLSVQFERTDKEIYLKAVIYKQQEKENLKIKVPDDIRFELQNNFCDLWITFFKDLDITLAENKSICQL